MNHDARTDPLLPPFRGLLFLPAVLAVLAACGGGDDLVADLAGQPDPASHDAASLDQSEEVDATVVEDLSPPPCNPSNCTLGCCLGDLCVGGTDVSGCGTAGAQCEVCASGAMCNSGRCKAPCSATNCAGCCAADGKCQAGTSDTAACGSSGEACHACAANQACAAGSCVADTCAATCAGCCTADGTCVPELDSRITKATCGVRGAACVACGVTQLCDEGWCAPVDCAQTCPAGCCLPDGTCMPGNSPSACGGGGRSCDVCQGWSCVPNIRLNFGGVDTPACYLPPDKTFDVILLDATLPSLDGSGSSWDAFGGLPDPYVTAVACDSPLWTNGQLQGLDPSCSMVVSTAPIADTLAPNFGEKVLFSEIDARHLRMLTFSVIDEDVAVDNLVMGCTLAFQPTLRNRDVFDNFQRALDGDTFEMGCQYALFQATNVGKLHVRVRPHL